MYVSSNKIAVLYDIFFFLSDQIFFDRVYLAYIIHLGKIKLCIQMVGRLKEKEVDIKI